MDQYNTDDTGTVPVPKPAVTRTPADIKIQQLEDQLVVQHREIAKLRREINRLKSQVDDVISVVRSRG